MAKHWSKKKGVLTGAQARQRARSKRRAEGFKQARKGNAPAPEYTERTTLLARLLGR